jgi:hypothetical protein
MFNEESKSTGCGHDLGRLWTAESCGVNQYWTMSDVRSNQNAIPKQCTDADAGEIYVRCCADAPSTFASELSCAELGWPLQVSDSPGGTQEVCGDSELRLAADFKQDPQANTCFYEQTHRQADIICRAAGARLCTAYELDNGETSGTGCGHDTNFVWSATACTLQDGEAGYYAALGRPDGVNKRRCQKPDDVVSIGVRCCADAAPPPLALTEKTCKELDLNGPSHPSHLSSPDICSFSYDDCSPIDGKPNPAELMTFTDAEAYCTDNSARLCSFSELLANEAAGTGCSYDWGLVWSMTPCKNCTDAGIWAVAGEISRLADAEERCLDPGADKAFVRCCATVRGMCDQAGTGANDCAALNREPCET